MVPRNSTPPVEHKKKLEKKARLSAAGTFGPAIIGTGTVDGDGLIHHELQKTSLCARSVVVLLGVAGKYVPRTKQAFLQARKSICKK